VSEKIVCRDKDGVVFSLEEDKLRLEFLEEIDSPLAKRLASRAIPKVILLSKIKEVSLKNNVIKIVLKGIFVKKEIEAHLEPECAKKLYKALLTKIGAQ